VNLQRGAVLVGTGEGENGEAGDDGYSKFVLSAMGATPSLRMSFGGDEKDLWLYFLSLKRVGILNMGVCF
jgi:hypothetical protein